MRGRRRILLGLLALLAGGLAWRVSRPAEVAPAPTDAAATSATAADAPLLAANDREAAEGYRLEDGVAVPRDRVSDAAGPGVIVVRVVDGDLKPVPGRTVEARPLWTRGGRPLLEAPRSRRTDAAGTARWTGLAPSSTWRVHVLSDARWTNSQDFVEVGSPLRTLYVSSLVPVSVRVTDGDGRGVSGAYVAVYQPGVLAGPPVPLPPPRLRAYPPPGPPVLVALTAEEGRAALSVPSRLREGVLWVGATGFAPWLESAWTVRDTDVRLEPAREIEGVVRDTKGDPVAEGVILWETHDLRGVDPVAYDGTFLILGLPSGDVRLEWQPKETAATEWRNAQHATAGGDPVTLVADLGASVSVRIEGWVRRPGGQAFLTLEDAVAPEAAERLEAEVDLDGVATFRRVVPGLRYVLWVPPRYDLAPDAKDAANLAVVYRRDVVAAEEPLRLSLEPGRTIRGVIDLAGTDAIGTDPSKGPWRFAEVRLAGPGLHLGGLAESNETPCDAREIPFRVDGVPSGAFRILVDLRVEAAEGTPDSYWQGDAPAPAGDEPVRVGLRRASRVRDR